MNQRHQRLLTHFLLVLPGFHLGTSHLFAQDVSFEDFSDKTGIHFVHTDGSTGKHFLIESMSGGLALLDFDCDGDLDIYFLNGAQIDDAELADGDKPRNALYRNDGEFHFTDVTRNAGVGNAAMGLGVASADFDNDGFPDIYVNNYGKNVLYRNNGDSTFEDITDQCDVGNGVHVGGGVSFLDMDFDGDLDLYVANYIQFDPQNHRPHIHKGVPAYPSPLSFDPDPDTLFRNNGDNTFSNVSVDSGIQAVAGRSMGLVAFDYDDDRDIDIVVANDTQENHLFENDGTGKFEEVALLAGVAYDFRGKAQASMGVELFDFNGDSLLDLCFTSFSEEFTTIYQNLGGGVFSDVTLQTGVANATFPHVTWGVVALDSTNQGVMDLFVGTGDLDDKRGERGGTSKSTSFNVTNVLLQNSPPKGLTSLGNDWGNAALDARSTRGVVRSDLNQDGLVDIVTQNARSRPSVLKNVSAAGNWVDVVLVGTSSNRNSIGARVVVEQAGQVQVREVVCGHSYQSDSGRRLHFGFPTSDEVSIKVVWPQKVGPPSTLVFAPANQVEYITEPPPPQDISR